MSDPEKVLSVDAQLDRMREDRDYWRTRAELAEERLDDQAWTKLTAQRDALADRVSRARRALDGLA